MLDEHLQLVPTTYRLRTQITSLIEQMLQDDPRKRCVPCAAPRAPCCAPLMRPPASSASLASMMKRPIVAGFMPSYHSSGKSLLSRTTTI